MSTLSLFTSQILLWNYLFPLALEEKKKKNREKTHTHNIFLIIAHRALPQKNKTGGKKGGVSEGGLFTQFH